MADHNDISMDNIPARRHARKLMRIGLLTGCMMLPGGLRIGNIRAMGGLLLTMKSARREERI